MVGWRGKKGERPTLTLLQLSEKMETPYAPLAWVRRVTTGRAEAAS
jgi:hypothetical protein